MRFFFYNNQGLPYAVTTYEGIEQSTIYDCADRPHYVTDANGVMVTNTFDDLGRLVMRGYPDGGVETFGYTPKGLVAYTNQIGSVWRYDADPAGRRIAETNANLEVIRYTNSPAGDLVSLKDGKDQLVANFFVIIALADLASQPDEAVGRTGI